MNTSSPRHPQPVSRRRDGILVEFWQMPSGRDEREALPECALYLDTHDWRDELRESARARMEHMERHMRALYGMGAYFVQNGAAHPYDLSAPGFLSGLLIRALIMDDMTGENTPLADPRLGVTNYLVLTPRQVRRDFFLTDQALRLRVFTREGDTPAHWWCQWMRFDGQQVLETFEIGADADLRSRVSERPLAPAPTPVPTPASTPAAAEPAFDDEAWQRSLRALKERYQRDARVRG